MKRIEEVQDYQQNIAQLQAGMQYGSMDRITLIRQVLQACGEPDEKYPVIHICGTNGKGSTSLMIAKLLQSTGLRVGTFTSPAIKEDREMIQIDQQKISYAAFNQAFTLLKQGLEHLSLSLDHLSVFEGWFILATLYFAEKKVDFAVIECGLGGALDATNGLSTAAYDIFTHIDYDHMALLGNRIEDIATTKAQIIRPGAQVIDYPEQYAVVSEIIQEQAKRQKANYHSAKTISLESIQMNLEGSQLIWQQQVLHLGLAGAVQQQNLRTVLAFVTVYNQQPLGPEITFEKIAQTLNHLSFVGRLQKIASQPLTYVDGGHNPDALKNLAELLQPYQATHQMIFVLGFLKDKAVAQNLKLFQEFQGDWIATTPDQPKRALSAMNLAQKMTTLLPKAQSIQAIASPQDAVKQARILAAGKKEPFIFIGGSFYVLKAVDWNG